MTSLVNHLGHVVTATGNTVSISPEPCRAPRLPVSTARSHVVSSRIATYIEV